MLVSARSVNLVNRHRIGNQFVVAHGPDSVPRRARMLLGPRFLAGTPFAVIVVTFLAGSVKALVGAPSLASIVSTWSNAAVAKVTLALVNELLAPHFCLFTLACALRIAKIAQSASIANLCCKMEKGDAFPHLPSKHVKPVERAFPFEKCGSLCCPDFPPHK